jgi:hypothetical protein
LLNQPADHRSQQILLTAAHLVVVISAAEYGTQDAI